MLGVNTFMQQFDNLKSTATSKVNEQKNNAFNLIDKSAEDQKTYLTSKRP
jgi:hypothetical protein